MFITEYVELFSTRIVNIHRITGVKSIILSFLHLPFVKFNKIWYNQFYYVKDG